MGNATEAVVVCSDRSMGIGISVWNIETGEHLLHIPTCAASPHGLLCLRNQFLVASQVNRHGSLGGGAIFIWNLNKPQSPLRSYTMEAIGPLSCTNDGGYIAGGAHSGNAYIWGVANGRLLKTWRAHHRALKCMAFSDDGSLLICGSTDGMICVWSMIRSCITGMLTASTSTSSVFISSSLDRTCKVWDLISGRLFQTQVYSASITAIAVHPVKHLLFSGSEDGRIFANELDMGSVEDPLSITEDRAVVLKGHNGSITALAFGKLGLISASEDCTFCLWDVTSWEIVQRLNHQKGAVTNVVPITLPSLRPVNQQGVSNQLRVSLLEKYPGQPSNPDKGVITFLSLCSALNKKQTSTSFWRTNLLDNLIMESEEGTPAAMQKKVERSMDSRTWATSMTKHVIEINKHLQTRLLDLMQWRLLYPNEIDSSPNRKGKKLKTESPPLDKQSDSSG